MKKLKKGKFYKITWLDAKGVSPGGNEYDLSVFTSRN